ncbi:MAG TPA: hypothetical protein VHM24_05715 [Gemmatimonadaceae bacterium]|nr:hypothetical protein [Gemmatimonadaceae bacterium]
MTFRRLWISLLVLPFGLHGCLILSGRCNYELRNVSVTGQLIAAPGDTLSARMNVMEHRDSDPNKTIDWLITGSVVQQVTSATLRDNANSSRIVFSFPVTNAPRVTILQGFAMETQGANVNGIYDLLAAGRGFLRLETNVAGRATIDVPLTVSQREDWFRPYCS